LHYLRDLYYFVGSTLTKLDSLSAIISLHDGFRTMGIHLGHFVAHHPVRRGPYETFLDKQHFDHVSPAYAKRFQMPDETEERYVERLKQELEDKFITLGPDTVIGCKYLASYLDSR